MIGETRGGKLRKRFEWSRREKIGVALVLALLMFASLCALPGTAGVAKALASSVTWIEGNAEWKYMDNGSNQGTAWRGASFNDSGWSTGAGPFGYSGNYTQTSTTAFGQINKIISYGPSSSNKYATSYFRNSFTVDDVNNIDKVEAMIGIDDGLVLYVNGQEAYRRNMPSGSVTYTTLASSALGPPDLATVDLTSSLQGVLHNGANVIAVEVHQATAGSSDLYFDMSLTLTPLTQSGITVSETGMAQVLGTDIPNNQLAFRMRALEGSFTINNEDGSAETFTVTIRNADPDYITVSEGRILSKGANSFVFEVDVPADDSVTVQVGPWYYPDPDNFYFIAWSDNQEGSTPFKNKLLAKAERINPVFSVNAGDVTAGTPGTVGGAGHATEYGYPNDYVKDEDYTHYLSLLENYTTPIFEVPGNHDLVRGGWVDRSDARYGMGEAMWNKYLGPTTYSFDVGNTHFMMTNFHYDMPDWTKRWGGNLNNGYLKMGTVGYQTTLPNDDVGEALYNWMNSTFAAAAGKTNKIAVSHHNFNMFVSDGNTVGTARDLYSEHDVSYMISGHQHNYQSNVDPVTGIPYLVIGTASHSNPAFALVHVNGSQITHQHMLADNINLSINYNGSNNGTLATNTATIQNSGYNMPFVRLKFKMSNDHAVYEAKDVSTGASIPTTFSKQFDDYTVVYVETSIGNGATRNVEVTPVAGANEINVALNKSVSTSDTGTPSPGYGPAEAVDGIGGQWDNGWSPVTFEGLSPWLQVDLGDEYVIQRVQVDDRPYDGQDGRPAWSAPRSNFEIRASNDPNFGTYAVLGSVGSTPYSGYVWNHSVTNTNAYRYIRYARTDTGYSFLSELRVFAEEGPSV
ncbi:metallophosphoesterase [Paenibacillus agaridevorans]|uniref:metallophosphoesterase n=1 Tax=Paenibacillus agaridevorans TaxID=171404 RepID=UPI001BE3E9C1|nr:metallophosphoesterase [Paenibacillus agaridevorans]